MSCRSAKAVSAVGLLLAVLCACESVPPERKPPPDSPFPQLKKITASDAQDYDEFGWSVGIDGDTVIAGTNMMFMYDYRPGKAIVYSRILGGTDNWGQAARISAADGEDFDGFGDSVAVSGDLALVGADGEDNVDIDVGSAYLFSRDVGGAGQWGQLRKLTAADGLRNDKFGFAVHLDGDTAVIGAPGRFVSGLLSGVGYIFDRNRGGPDNWGEVKELFPSDSVNSGNFGFSVAVNGDTAVIGDVGNGGGGYLRGAAYVFSRDLGGAGNWGEVKKLTAIDGEDRDIFGCSVAIFGDLIIVGADWKHEAGVEMGAAYIFGRNQGGPDNWGLIKELTASDAAGGDCFGSSVAISGDYALVGALGKDGTVQDIGAVYVFQKDLGGADNWGEAGKVMPADANEGCEFGQSASLSGDLFVVGAPLMRSGGAHRGSVYVFRIKS